MSHDKAKRLIGLIQYKDYLQSNSLPRLDNQEFWGQKTNPVQKESDKIFRQVNRMSADELFVPPYEKSPLAVAIKLGDTSTAFYILEKEGITSSHLLAEDRTCPALIDAENHGNDKVAEKIKSIIGNEQVISCGMPDGTQIALPTEVGLRSVSIRT